MPKILSVIYNIDGKKWHSATLLCHIIETHYSVLGLYNRGLSDYTDSMPKKVGVFHPPCASAYD